MNSIRTIIFSAFLIGLSGALVPGPMLAATIASVPRYGAWAGPWIVFGHGVAEIVVIAAIVFGLGKLLSRNRVLACVGLGGGAALVWFGWLTISIARTVSLSSDGPGSLSMTMHPFVAGIATSVLNPYWLFWWATIGVSYVGLSMRFGRLGLSLFSVGHIMADAVWFTLVSTALAFGRTLIGDTAFRTIVVVCGAGLILFGLRFAYSGVTRWRQRPATAEDEGTTDCADVRG